MAAQSKRSTKRAAAAMDKSSQDTILDKPAKKTKITIATRDDDGPQKLKNIPKFLHSIHDHTYFSRQWWKEMLVKDEFWELLNSNLTQAIRNKRLRIEIDIGVDGVAEPKAKTQAQAKAVRKTKTSGEKANSKQASSSVQQEAVISNVVACQKCDQEIKPGEQSCGGPPGKIVCKSCHLVTDDGKAHVLKTSVIKHKGQAILASMDPLAAHQEGPLKGTLADSSTSSSSIRIGDDDTKPSQNNAAGESEAETSTDIEKQNDNINAALQAFNSKIPMKSDHTSTE